MENKSLKFIHFWKSDSHMEKDSGILIIIGISKVINAYFFP